MPRLSKIGAAALAAFGWSSGTSGVTATYLQVAGGGGGGNLGGGGGGGYLTGTTTLNSTLSYTVIIGAGGATSSSIGIAGNNSQFGTLTASVGGGYGAGNNTRNGGSGGSGGGAGGDNGVNGTPGSATSGQGNAGGNANTNGAGTQFGGGGGGGAGTAGSAAPSTTAGGAGGNGTASSISGTSVTYAGGGGGGSYALGGTGTAGAGGTGGGGTGGVNGTPGTSGTANLGAGGGAGGFTSAGNAQAGGNGGSGIVIISYAGAQQFGGGVVTSVGGNTIHTFTTSGTLSPIASLSASYLVVAGGGGGARNQGGGGGAGGLLTGSGLILDTNSNYLVTVGAGGAGGIAGTPIGVSGTASVFLSKSAAGGGGGGTENGNGVAGGSGGGAGRGDSGGTTGGAGNTPSTSPSQGNSGGNNTFRGSSGGGGAGAIGSSPTGDAGADGGVGVASSISGTSTYYAGGGGGGSYDSSITGGNGGNGGGGHGAGTLTAGTANTGGGGGGGAGNAPYNGAAGGSGVVIISYAGAPQFGGGTVTSVGGNTIHTFTSSGYLSPIVLLNRSLRFRSSASAYLNRTPASAGNRQTWTWSGWVKRGKLGATQGLFARNEASVATYIIFTSSDTLTATSASGAVEFELVTTQVFRDPSAWYHIAVALDTTQATSSNRVKMYVNGTQITAFSTASYPSQNYSAYVNTAATHYIGNGNPAGSLGWYSDQYLTEINFIDGQALTPSSFGSFNAYGSWSPVRYGGSYGTNGFYLPFTNNASTTTLGYDFSPNGNNWTTNNISLTAGSTYDSMTDVPTLTSATAANYCVYNPLSGLNSAASYLSQANLYFYDNTNSGSWRTLKGTIGMPIGSAKYYWELAITNPSGSIGNFVGIDGVNDATTPPSNNAYALYWSAGNFGKAQNNGSITTFSGTPANGDVLSIAYDAVTGKIWFGKNGTWFEGDPSAGTGASYTGITAETIPFGSTFSNSGATGHYVNFGQRPFTYTPPSGFVALNTYNL